MNGRFCLGLRWSQTAYVLAALLAVAAPALAASTAASTNGSPGTTQVRAAAERSITLAPSKQNERDKVRRDRPMTPAFHGARVPVELAASLRAQMGARVDKDLAKIRDLRDEGAILLTKFIAEAPKDTPEMPEALIRLGELKWEMAREQYLVRFMAWEKKPVDQRGPTPVGEYGPSRELFARVLHEYPTFRDYDLALYVDGFLATEQSNEPEALERFSRILREFPGSRFVPDAHMAQAEHLFGSQYDYAGALREYEQVLTYKTSDLYGIALFKSAWCLWRLGQNDAAAARFVNVFEVTDRGSKGSVQQRAALDELQAEALKYLVEVFTEDERNSAADMARFLQKIGGDRFAGRIVRALAATFYDQAHYERGIEAYELLLRLEPTSDAAPDWMLAIAQGYAMLEEYPKLRATYDRMLATYGMGGPWSRTQTDPRAAHRALERIEAQLREHALGLHAKAQRDKTSRAEFLGAAGLYDVYLAHFGNSPSAYEIHFHLAEIQFFHSDEYMPAAINYMAAARTAPQRADLSDMRHDALYNAIAALEHVRAAEIDARKGKPGREAREAHEETEVDRRFAEALELYAQLYPRDPALPELFFRQGKLYYDSGVYDPAVRIWGSLLERFPNSHQAQGAGELILDSFNRSKDYENIEAWARRLKAAPAFQSKAAQSRLDALIVQAVFKQGEQHASKGDHAGAAQAYLRAAREFPRDARATQACANSAFEARKSGDLATVRQAGQLALAKDYQSRPEAPLAAWTAASTLQSMGLFAEAAEFDEQMTQLVDKEHPQFQKFEHAKDAAYNAVVLRIATNEPERAIAAGNRFTALYPGTPEADDVVFEMGKADQSAGKFKEAADLYRRSLARARTPDRRIQGFVLLAAALVRAGDERGASDALAQATYLSKHAHGSLGPEGREASAHARYMEGERVLAKFEKVQISGDVRQLASRLRQKSELLKQAASAFLDAASLGVAEWTTASLYQVGRTYELYARALRDAPAPPNLSDADKEAYSQQIDEFVVPIEERSLDAYETGWKKAMELGIYNQWTAKMREALGVLNAELYPPLREIGFDVRTQGTGTLPPLLDAPKRAKGGTK